MLYDNAEQSVSSTANALKARQWFEIVRMQTRE